MSIDIARALGEAITTGMVYAAAILGLAGVVAAFILRKR